MTSDANYDIKSLHSSATNLLLCPAPSLLCSTTQSALTGRYLLELAFLWTWVMLLQVSALVFFSPSSNLSSHLSFSLGPSLISLLKSHFNYSLLQNPACVSDLPCFSLYFSSHSANYIFFLYIASCFIYILSSPLEFKFFEGRNLNLFCSLSDS